MINSGTPPRKPNQIGRYELIGLLATGGMAQVYLAMSGELSGFRTLAVVKRVLPHLSSNSEFIQMFLDEARLAAQLDHPNIARIIEVGQDQDEYFLAMEVVQGRPLSALLRRARKREQPLTHPQAAFVVAQAGRGLSYAHNLTDGNGRPLGVVHRDVSPQNILVSFEGAVKVIDFGVARALGRVTETVPGGLKGKIQYMSPEQASGDPVDRRSDVFSLGVVLWEGLCGRRLFRRESDLETLRAIIQEPIPAPSKVVRVSPRLERIVMQALERDPEDRFQTAEEMALELERHAFTTAGFSPTQISTAMKDLFGSDFTRWRRTVAAAMDLGSTPAEWGDVSGTFLRPPDVDLRSRGSTIALHPVVSLQETGPLTGPTRDHRSDSRSAQSDFMVADLPPRPQRRWFVGGALILMLAIVGVGVLAFSHGRALVTAIRPAGGGSHETPVTAAARPAESVRPTIVAAAPPPVPSESPPPETVPAEPPASPPLPPQPEPRAKPQEDTLRDAWAAVDNHPRSQPGKPAARTTAHPRAERRAPSRPVDSPATAAPRAIDPWDRPAAPKTAASASASAEASAKRDTQMCSVRLGTQPWAEVWLDGKNTGAHTPFAENIPCGAHVVTFKRPDLGLTKAYTITVRAGSPLRQSFPFR